MELFSKALKDISINDIEALVHNKIPESRTLDYKLEVHPSSDAGNKEFLKDISAFANTVGGYLIYGVNEGGIPGDIQGVDVDDFDKMKLRFENLLRTGVDPPIRGVDFAVVDLKDSKKVIVVHVPKSVARPHAVKIKDHFRFYGRNSGGVYPLEVDDLRRAFLASETLGTRIRNFKSDRLAQIATGEGHIRLEDGAKTVLHLIPVSAFELERKYDLRPVSGSDIQTMEGDSSERRYNFDGLVCGNFTRTIVGSYTQLYHNGIIEAVTVKLIEPQDGEKFIPMTIFEQKIVESFQKYIAVLGKIGVDFPMWVALSLLRVKGYRIPAQSISLPYKPYNHPIDQDELIIPEIQVERLQVSGEEILKPAFDAIWNACGYERSFNYDENGKWKLRK